MLSCSGANKQAGLYKTEKAAKGDVTMTVTATGTLSAVTTVQIGRASCRERVSNCV